MIYKKIVALCALSVGISSGVAVAPAQISVGIGVAPACPYGYYDYAPYSCSPYGYYGPDWFNGGLFIGAGPWFRGGRGFYGHVDDVQLVVVLDDHAGTHLRGGNGHRWNP